MTMDAPGSAQETQEPLIVWVIGLWQHNGLLGLPPENSGGRVTRIVWFEEVCQLLRRPGIRVCCVSSNQMVAWVLHEFKRRGYCGINFSWKFEDELKILPGQEVIAVPPPDTVKKHFALDLKFRHDIIAER